MTNGDKIRAMSNEELVNRLYCESCIYMEEAICRNDCEDGIKAYLDMEVEE